MKLNIKTIPLRGIELSEDAKGIINPSFITLIVGPPGSGKSSLITALIQDQRIFGGKFDQIIFVGPTPPSQLQFDQSNSISSPQPQVIEQFINEFNKTNSYEDFNLLFIFDDCVSQMAKKQQFWKKLFLNRRHLIKNGNISHMITTQKFSLVPTFIRTCLTDMYIFKCPAYEGSAFSKFYLDKDKGQQLIKRMTTLGKHEFIYINLLTSMIYNNQFRQIKKVQCKLRISGVKLAQQSTQLSQQLLCQPYQNHLPSVKDKQQEKVQEIQVTPLPQAHITIKPKTQEDKIQQIFKELRGSKSDK